MRAVGAGTATSGPDDVDERGDASSANRALFAEGSGVRRRLRVDVAPDRCGLALPLASNDGIFRGAPGLKLETRVSD